MMIETSLYQTATRFLGLREIAGSKDNPFIQWCLSICKISEPIHDETPWCSAFVNGLCYILGLPRSGSAAARSWLLVGTSISIDEACQGNDIVIIKRGADPQPGPDVIKAQGHVGIYSSQDLNYFKMLGGNQGDQVSLATFPKSSILGVRRLTIQS